MNQDISQLISTLNRDLQRELTDYIGISETDKMKKAMVTHQLKQKFINSEIFLLGLARRQSKTSHKYLKSLKVWRINSIYYFTSLYFDVRPMLWGRRFEHTSDPFLFDILFSKPIHENVRLASIKPSVLRHY